MERESFEVARNQIRQQLDAGHSKKAESSLNKLVGGMTLDEVKAEEMSLRSISAMFLPAHKARCRRIEDLISRRLTEKHFCTLSIAETTVPESETPLPKNPLKVEQRILPKPQESVDVKEREFQALVAEMRPLGFTRSADVSNYIVKNRLGNKYGHISGILTMEGSGNQWEFVGGFPPKIYARLCDELGLGNQGTDAKPVHFVPFNKGL